jgi:EcoRII C terminal.
MPRGDVLAKRALDKLKDFYKTKGVDMDSPQYIKSHCDGLLSELLESEFELYKQEEQQANIDLLWQIVKSSLPASRSFTENQLEQLIKGKFNEFQDFYKSILQSRKTRAGGSLQNHIAYLFGMLEYPFEAQQEIDGKPDFILPNAALYLQNPGECILVTAKRTLRERWRQIITEGFKSPQYFLVTIDERQTRHNLKEMAGHRIYLVVPEHLKLSIQNYKAAGNVISVKSFFEGYLDPAMARWRHAGIVP